MNVSELVNKSEVLDIWNNYWITDMTTLDAENQLRELATVELKSAPQLNENQQQVLGWLKTGHCSGNRVFEALERVTYVYEDPKTEESLESLSPDQEVQVITTFMEWALEQEEE